MEYRFTADDDQFRGDLRRFIQSELPPDWEGGGRWPEEYDWDFTMQLRRRLADRGWLTMHWADGIRRTGRIPCPFRHLQRGTRLSPRPGRDIFGVRMLGPTLMLYGSEEQKQTHLPPIARGEIQWCQGYSEPESGSDLASLSTRAVRDGDDYIITGAKIWTTLAHHSDWIMCLARTDPDAPRHRGISFILVDLKSPGVSVHPVVNMAGGHEFNQVIFDNVRVPASNVVGEENRGWYVAVTLLDFERSGIDYSAIARRLLDDTREYAAGVPRNGHLATQLPWVRNLLADRYIECEVARLLAYNVAWNAGPGPGAEQGSVHEQGIRQRNPASRRQQRPGNRRPARRYGPRRKPRPAERPAGRKLDDQLLPPNRRWHFRSAAGRHRRPGPGPAPRLGR